jgi:hypothetical protein
MWCVIRELILCLCAGTGAVVAVLGLSTWRAQLCGRTEYRLARRVLTAMLRYREAVRSARFPSSSIPLADPKGKMPQHEWCSRAIQRDYAQRWNRIARARSAIEAHLIEAEAVWGKSCLAPFTTLWKLENDLYGAFLEQIDLCDPNNKETVSPEKRKELRYILLRRPENDLIDTELDKAIDAIQERLAPHISSRPRRWNLIRRLLRSGSSEKAYSPDYPHDDEDNSQPKERVEDA